MHYVSLYIHSKIEFPTNDRSFAKAPPPLPPAPTVGENRSKALRAYTGHVAIRNFANSASGVHVYV